MSIKKYANAKDIFDKLLTCWNLKGYKELAAHIGVPYQTLMAWKKRNSIGDYSPFMDKGISKKWLETGEGEMFTERNEQPLTIAERIGEGYSPEARLAADYLEVKIKGKTAEERLKIVEELMEEIRSKYK